jgi:hypothetical protein
MNIVETSGPAPLRTLSFKAPERGDVAHPARLDAFVPSLTGKQASGQVATAGLPASLTAAAQRTTTSAPLQALPAVPSSTPPASTQPPSSAAAGSLPSTTTTNQAAGRILTSSAYRYGAEEHEFTVDARNLSFAQNLFALDPAFVELVKAPDSGLSLSVIYHSDGKGASVDAYRAAIPATTTAPSESADKKKDLPATFSVYKVKNPAFDPSGVCANEQFTKLADDTLFGTVDASSHLLVPQQADASLKGWLNDNGFVSTKTVSLGELTQDKAAKAFFGLDDKLPVEVYDPKGGAFIDHVKIYYDLLKASPEYRAEQAGVQMGSVGNALLLGVITPVLWSEGTTYGIAATMASLDNIVSPSLGILGSGVFGGVVSAAVNSEHPLDNLKKIDLGVAAANTVTTASVLALHPTILKMISSSHPAVAAVSLYAAQDVINAFSGDAASRSQLAVEDEIINKNPPPGKSYSKNFFQIQGVEASLSRALSVGTYAASVGAAAAFPGLALPFAVAGATISVLGGYIFPLYHDKPEVKVTIEGRGFVTVGDHCVFDSGWEVAAKGGDMRIVKEDAHHYSIAVREGSLDIKNDTAHPLEVSHDRHLIDYLPKLLKPRSMGVKEEWGLSNDLSEIQVARYGNTGYHVSAVSNNEVLVSR